jgi:osmotically inducible lipoprotein OsmB
MAMSADMKPKTRENIQEPFAVRRAGRPEASRGESGSGKGFSGAGIGGGGLAPQPRLHKGADNFSCRRAFPIVNDEEVLVMTRHSRAAARPYPALLGPLLAACLLLGLIFGLAGCGADPATRGVSGGLIGAGAGAGVAAIAGGRPATGALIGAGAGALGGVLTAH